MSTERIYGRDGQFPQSLCEANRTGMHISYSVFWARVVNSEHESLLTQYTKHTFYELQYMLEGQAAMLIGDMRLTIGSGELIVVPPDTFHQIVEADVKGSRFIMAFDISAADGDDLTAQTVEALRTPRVRTDTPFFAGLLALLLASGASAAVRDSGSLLLECFLLELLGILTPAARESVQNEDEGVGEILHFIRSRHGVEISVESLSRRFALSKRQLYRVLTRATGQTPKVLIQHERLKYIEELVASTSLSLSEISEFCGFSDEYAMNKFFRRFARINLSEYRKIARR